MTQLNLFQFALPTVWIIAGLPEEEGKYKCRVRMKNGDIEYMELDFDNGFVLGDDVATVLAWR